MLEKSSLKPATLTVQMEYTPLPVIDVCHSLTSEDFGRIYLSRLRNLHPNEGKYVTLFKFSHSHWAEYCDLFGAVSKRFLNRVQAFLETSSDLANFSYNSPIYPPVIIYKNFSFFFFSINNNSSWAHKKLKVNSFKTNFFCLPFARSIMLQFSDI